MSEHPLRLTSEQVRNECSIDHFDFETTEDIAFAQSIIGQPRGVRAIEFGIDIEARGFNIYILGPTGTGRTTAVRQFLEERAKAADPPNDWVYVNNFEAKHRPRAIEFPAGKGNVFHDQMKTLVERLQEEIPGALDADEFLQGMETLEQGFSQQRSTIFETFDEEAKERGFTVVRTPAGLMVVPLNEDGEPMPQEKLKEVPEEERKKMEATHNELQGKLETALRQVRDLDQEYREDQERLRKVAAAFVLDQHIGDLREAYADHKEVQEYLTEVREDVLENLELFDISEDDNGQEGSPPGAVRMLPDSSDEDLFTRYAVNLIVDHSKTEGVPVVVEDLPSYASLVGRIEGEVKMGALHTDFTMIKPGSLHKANGGYLVLRVTNLLTHPGAWDGLKRALNSNEVRIEESMIRQGVGILTPQTIDPEPIPLDLKVILLGSPTLYYMLFSMEEDFPELFKVKADFASTMPRNHDTELEYATFIASRCHEHKLPHFTREAVGEMVEYASRMADDQQRLTTLFGHIADMVHEAAYWAQKDEADRVEANHVLQAIEEREYRSNLVEERTHERFEEGTIFIDTEGEVIGQINSLTVVSMGDYMFGQPSRITARVFPGKERVLNIEREAALSGPLHDKGVLILQGYLGGQYAIDYPLALSASITFEQSYGGVDGDSASSTELYALLSALSGHPIKQSLAVTGSVNQLGEVQPIGGVNQKIEGFFDVCLSRGLTGEQGVIIPEANVKNLMLRPDVVEAIKEGTFHVYAITTIDEGIELLTDIPAGTRKKDGTFPTKTVHYAVQARLRELADAIRDFENPAE